MKEIEVQTVNENKEIVKSDVITIDDTHDRIKLIVTVYNPRGGKEPPDMRLIQKVHEKIVNGLKDNAKVFTIPDYIRINTIKI